MKHTVTFNVEIPNDIDATISEIEAWVEFNIGGRGGLDGDNPLVDCELEACPYSVFVD